MKSKRSKIQPDVDAMIPDLINVFRRYMKLGGPIDSLQTREFRSVVDSVKKIDQVLLHGAPEDFYTREIVASYLLYHFPLHYQQGFSLISELPTTPQRVLEIGSGSAPFAFAALKLGASEVFAIDQNEEALRLGSEFIGRQGYPITMRRWSYPNSIPLDGKFDLIILPYCLTELTETEEEREAFILKCMDKLDENGFLMIVEPTEQERNTQFLKMRDSLVSKGIPVQAPCIWKGECPALRSKSPCYAQREYEKPYLMKEIQRGADIFLNSLKMSYLILRKPQASWPNLGPQKYYRVVSPPIESYPGKRYYLCGSDGKQVLDLRTDRKYNVPRGSVITIGGESEYTQILAPGKPLFEVP
ncbi:MAG: hypothetical protein JWO53_829 [Chlamydiia bacterium]|nr:hypothetical protein [Chlamydiia bacterium]